MREEQVKKLKNIPNENTIFKIMEPILIGGINSDDEEQEE